MYDSLLTAYLIPELEAEMTVPGALTRLPGTARTKPVPAITINTGCYAKWPAALIVRTRSSGGGMLGMHHTASLGITSQKKITRLKST